MKSKVAVLTVLCAGVVIGSLYVLRYNHTAHSSNEAPAEGNQAAVPKQSAKQFAQPAKSSLSNPGLADTSSESAPASVTVKPAAPGGSAAAMAVSPETKHQEYVRKRIAQLEDLAYEDDTASLETILSELTNRDPEIRKAALEATIQFGSRDAIPRLADAAVQTEDPEEKTALNEAIEFLKLPSLTEVLAQQKANQTATQPRKAVRARVIKELPAATTPQ
jgi:hypothetical protein